MAAARLATHLITTAGRAITTWLNANEQLPALQNGNCIVRLTNFGQIAFTRSFEGQTMLAAFNNQDSTERVSIPKPGMAAWKFRNALRDGEERFVSETEVLELVPLPNSGQVWVSSY